MLRFELYCTLYLLLGTAYFMFVRNAIKEVLDENETGVNVMVGVLFILFWLPIALIDLGCFVYSLRPRKRGRDEDLH